MSRKVHAVNVVDSTRIDDLIRSAVFDDPLKKEASRKAIRQLAREQGIVLRSIQGLYEAAGKGLYQGKTVPAMNIRGITYHAARAAFRAVRQDKVGAFIFELARSEMGYTDQRPDEYAVCILAAAIREGFRGPVFIQGDHYQVNRTRFVTDPNKEISAIKDLVKESVEAGFLNIDVDASTIVDINQSDLFKQQENNCAVMAEMTAFIRSVEPKGVTISIGGEIGEVGKQNSTVQDFEAFMEGYLARLTPGLKGISKISVQTGTSHGGVVLPDGSIKRVQLDFKVLEDISRAAREKYGMAGAVQHGASTLSDENFDLFPKAGAAEVHLATGFQNIILDDPHFPAEFRDRIYGHLAEKYANERAAGETDEQFHYKTRKKAFGDFKKEMWSLPEENLAAIRAALEERFRLLFKRLNVVNTTDLVKKFVKGGK